MQKGLSISPDDEYLLAYQSRMASIRGDMDTAIALYRPLIESRVTEAHLHYDLASHYYRAGRYREAIDSYRHALRLNPEQPDAHLAIGRIRALQLLKNDSMTALSQQLPRQLMLGSRL